MEPTVDDYEDDNENLEALINTGKWLQSFFSSPLCNGTNSDFLKSVDKLYLN